MTQEITTPVVLAHNNLVPGTEVVSVRGATIALIRNSDYIIDYAAGELRFLSDGAAVELGDLIESNGVDVIYSYKIDFNTPGLFESQIEVYSEVALRVSNFVISVANGPIGEVNRILNLTTQEEYVPSAINGQQITFDGQVAPRTFDVTGASTTLQSSKFDTRQVYLRVYSVNYPSNFVPDLNPIVSILAIRSTSQYPRILVIGGQDVLNNSIQISVPLEVSGVILITGGRALRTSTTTLQQGTDYTVTFTPIRGVISTLQLTISLTTSGLLKIRTNSLYAVFSFAEQATLNGKGQFQSLAHPVNDPVNFTSDTQPLANFHQQASPAENSFDTLVLPDIEVIDSQTGLVFTPGTDYSISSVQRTITKLPGSRIGTSALINYIEQRVMSVDFTLVQDVVLVDYVWGSNSINWSILQKNTPVTLDLALFQNQQFITLSRPPLDENAILIYLQSDPTKRPQTTTVSYNRSTQRLQIVPIPANGVYVVEYTAVDQPISENTLYYTSYKYGATRKVVGGTFAPLFGLTNTTAEREETFSMSAGQTSVQLPRAPISLDTIQIYNAGDPQKTAIATPTNYDSITGILYFTSIITSGQKVVQYLTTGFDTQSLRHVIQKLFLNFPVGPTEQGFQNIVAGFVDTPATITSGLQNRFVLPNKQHTIGNAIRPRDFEESPPLSDGAPSVTFIPARFNLGAVLESSRGGYVRTSAADNLGLLEGTLEFLTGILFNPTDNQLHYFMDIMGPDPRKNRFSLYKNTKNQLNFDIWDKNGNLYRTGVDVSQVYHTEILRLKAGQDHVKLTFPATPAQLDLDDNKTPDLYEGLETKFIILPDTATYPPTFKRASIKVLSFDPPTNVVTFEPVAFSGRYVFSYVGGLARYEETDNFIAITWKLHTQDGKAPFYRLYLNGVLVVNQTLAELGAALAAQAAAAASGTNTSTYDKAQYDKDPYKP